MKNQYFGDITDLFKWDLILEILTKIRGLNHFTYIPMLTPDDDSRDGMRLNYSKKCAGAKREEFVKFLQDYIKKGRRDIRELKRFFRGSELTKGLSIDIYKESEYFTHEKRKEYFENISKDLLSSSLIEVDQDIGIEVKNMRGREEKYIKYEEINILFNRMDENSVLMIWQFIPRVKREPYFLRLSEKLEAVTGTRPLYISDNKVVFFILVKNEKLRNLVHNVICEYAKTYSLLVGK